MKIPRAKWKEGNKVIGVKQEAPRSLTSVE